MARTSKTDPLRIAEVSAVRGVIGITFCPGEKDLHAASGVWDRDLGIDLEAIRAWGAVALSRLPAQYRGSRQSITNFTAKREERRKHVRQSGK